MLKKILIGSRNLLLFLFVSSLLDGHSDIRTVSGRQALQVGT